MRDPSPETFERLLAGLSQPALAAFVADLWAARGWETRVVDADHGTRVVCTRPEETVTLLLPPRRSIRARVRRAVRPRFGRGDESGSTGDVADADAGVDVVVAPVADTRVVSLAAAADARVHDARAIYDRALYGLDRSEADDLFRRHLGRGVAVHADPTPAPDEPVRADDTVDSWWPSVPPSHGEAREPRTLVTLAVAVAVIAAALLGGFVGSIGTGFAGDGVETGSTGGAFGDGFEIAPGPAAGQGDPGGFAGVDPEGTGPPPGDVTTTDSPTARLLAPGLTREGVVSPDALAAAHASRVDGRSYVWRVNYVEQSAGTLSSARAVHRVRNASVLRVDVDTTGVLVTDPGRLVPRPAYADGSRRYVLSRGQVLRRPLESRDHYAGHAEGALARLLRANESEVVGSREERGTFLYVVSLSGSPDPDREAYRATVLVTRGGAVHIAEAQWEDADSNAVVSVRAAYDFDADPNVTRPGWMGPADDARTDNSTAQSSSGAPAER